MEGGGPASAHAPQQQLQQQQSPAPPMQPAAADRDALSTNASVLHFGPGLHLLDVAEFGEPGVDTLQDLDLPAMHLVAVPGDEFSQLAIVANSAGMGAWLPADGGTVIVQAPPDGGDLIVTVYAPADLPCPTPRLTIRRLDRDRLDAPRGEAGMPETAHAPSARVLDLEVVLHIQRLGDRRFVGSGWFGVREQHLQIEAFSIRPLDTLSASDIEFMGFGPGRRQTPWVTDARLCGTRGRALPLTGFAVRLTPQLRERFDIAYDGAFFESGVVGPCRNGDPCLPPIPDDPLAAINVRITERSGPMG
jgi:hypothetical protein